MTALTTLIVRPSKTAFVTYRGRLCIADISFANGKRKRQYGLILRNGIQAYNHRFYNRNKILSLEIV